MRPKILTWLTAIGLATAAATPALAHGTWYGPAPSFSYQNPDGSYDSYSDFIRDLRGIPCGIECTQRAEVRWGLAPPPHPHRHHHHYYNRY